MEEIGDAVRAEVVEPLCDRFGLGYLAGNGRMIFHNDKLTVGSIDDVVLDVSGPAREPLLAAFDILNIEVSHNDYLGFYVRDVPAKSGRGKRRR